MSTYAELKTAVKDLLQISLNVSDSFQGEAADSDRDALLDIRILRAANNARLWAERQHDFAENDVAIRVNYIAGYPCPMVGVDNTHVATQAQKWWGADLKLSGTAAGTLESPYIKQLAASGTLTLQSVWDYTNVKTASYSAPSTAVDFTRTLASITSAFASTDVGKTFDNFAFADTSLTSTASRVYKLKTLNRGFRAENTGDRPLYIRSRQAIVTSSRRQLDLEEADPYLRYPDDDVTETRPVYLVTDGDKFRIMPEYDNVVILEGNKWMTPYTADTDSDFLLQNGFDFMMWQTVIEMNHLTQTFVPRQEGSLSPPERLRNESWAALVAHDDYRFEGGVALDIG